MKEVSLIFFCLFGFLLSVKSAVNPELKQELRRMCDNDQYMLNHGDKPATLKINSDSVFITKQGLWAIHLKRLKEIFEQYGFPDYNMVDTVGAYYFWILVQHQDGDTTFQKEVWKAMSIKINQGLAAKKYLAYLTDRVLINTGHKQIYGTQMTDRHAGVWQQPKPIEDPVNVDRLRSEVGLDSLTAYIRLMNSHYIDSAGNLYYR